MCHSECSIIINATLLEKVVVVNMYQWTEREIDRQNSLPIYGGIEEVPAD